MAVGKQLAALIRRAVARRNGAYACSHSDNFCFVDEIDCALTDDASPIALVVPVLPSVR
jgi:hypothetical protein